MQIACAPQRGILRNSVGRSILAWKTNRFGRIAMSLAPALPAAEPYFQTEFSPDEFARRRAEVAAKIGDGVAVLQGAPATGAFDLFRQYNDFFYLTGVETPHAYLSLDGRSGRSVLYLLSSDEELADKEGAELCANEADIARRITGIDDVKPLAALVEDLRSAKSLYVCQLPQEGRQACQDTLRVKARLAAGDPWQPGGESFSQLLARLLPSADIRDLSTILGAMRQIKSSAEIDLMRRAGKITALAVAEAMRSTAPGLLEGQLGAIADYVYLLNGASGGGYRPIIASGKNIWNMHYYRNNCRLVSGELVLMDYAPDCTCYTSDIGRMWPVNGRFEPWQRELYGFVVDYHFELFDRIAPGKTGTEICQQVAAKMLPTVERTNWTRPSFKDAVVTLLQASKPFTHGVGMAVHDGPRYHEEPLHPGIVFALDPQLWVKSEQLYIRVEDTVVVTERGAENLTPNCAHTPDDIERLMTEPGLIQSRPDLCLA
jgi:Xaa-Pro aminopeptidase